jgi:DGQHR domain-containing protein
MMLQPATESSETIRLEVIKLRQKGIPMYFGKMRAKDLVDVADVDTFEEEELEGYQRELLRKRTEDIRNYLVNCPIAIMPSVFISLRDRAKFVETDGSRGLGVIDIRREKGAIGMIDGQHRIAGFERVLKGEGRKLVRLQTSDPEVIADIAEYEIAVVILDSQEAIDLVRPQLANPDVFTKEDVERTVFTVVNKTAVSINPTLKDQLVLKIYEAGIKGIPFIEKEPWRTTATKIVIALHKDGRYGSPLAGKVNMTGASGMGRAVKLASFVTSLRPLVKENQTFKPLGGSEGYTEEKLKYVVEFWKGVAAVCKDGFQYPKDYMLLKAIGVYTVNALADDVLDWLNAENLELTVQNVLKFIAPLETFEWHKERSSLAFLSSLKGVREGHRLLLEHLRKAGVVGAAETCKHMPKKEERQAHAVQSSVSSKPPSIQLNR